MEEISLDGKNIFVIKSDSEIPLIEQNLNDGSWSILCFTSRESADRFCYHQNISKDRVTSLSRKPKESIEQVGLVRLSKIVSRHYPMIKFFLFDHPGRKGKAKYVDVKNIVVMGFKNSHKTLANWVADHLDGENEEEWLEWEGE